MQKGIGVKQTNDTFFRELHGVKIEPQTREINQVLNNRKFEGNNSKPYKNMKEWEEATL